MRTILQPSSLHKSCFISEAAASHYGPRIKAQPPPRPQLPPSISPENHSLTIHLPKSIINKANQMSPLHRRHEAVGDFRCIMVAYLDVYERLPKVQARRRQTPKLHTNPQGCPIPCQNHSMIAIPCITRSIFPQTTLPPMYSVERIIQ